MHIQDASQEGLQRRSASQAGAPGSNGVKHRLIANLLPAPLRAWRAPQSRLQPHFAALLLTASRSSAENLALRL
jgi:hypothetical protein